MTRTTAWIVGMVAMVAMVAPAGATESCVPTSATMTALRRLPVQDRGRVKPFDSFAREWLDLVTGHPQWHGEDPVMTVLDVMTYPTVAQAAPMIAIPFAPLREALGLPRTQTHVSYDALVESRALMRRLPEIVGKQSHDEPLSMLEQETMDAFERFSTFSELAKQELTLAPPAEGGVAWRQLPGTPLAAPWQMLLAARRANDPVAFENAARDVSAAAYRAAPRATVSRWRITLEVLYHQVAPFAIARGFYVLAALAIGIAVTTSHLAARRLGLLGVALAWAVHLAGLLTRVAVGGRPPVSNFYETMLWLPFVAVTIALILERRRPLAYAALASAIVAAIMLSLTEYVPLDPSIAPVVAVLRSQLWLTIHVLTIVASYGALALAMVLAHFYSMAAIRGGDAASRQALDGLLSRALQIGVVLLAAGIMLGAVWANASWGRYWGWDPKETWALITLLWFLAVLHGRIVGWLDTLGVALATITGFFLLLMTYYGVSFYLVGLHSYAGGHAKPLPPLVVGYVVAELAFLGAILLQRRPSRS